MLDKYALKERLDNGVVTVIFEKADGTEREMRCTLSNLYVPQVLSEYEGNEAKPVTELFRVWDIDSNDWRSFHYGSVKQILSE